MSGVMSKGMNCCSISSILLSVIGFFDRVEYPSKFAGGVESKSSILEARLFDPRAKKGRLNVPWSGVLEVFGVPWGE